MLVAQAEESDAFRAGLFTTGGAGTFFFWGGDEDEDEDDAGDCDDDDDDRDGDGDDNGCKGAGKKSFLDRGAPCSSHGRPPCSGLAPS